MLDQLSARLQKALKFLRGEGKITEKNLNEALRMIRLAFLEADVNYKVVKEFEAQVKAKALNERVLESLTPAQQQFTCWLACREWARPPPQPSWLCC